MQPASSVLLLLPQAAPFVFVDELVAADDEKTTTLFSIHRETIFLEEGFFREAGLLENMAQTAAAGAGYKAKSRGEPVLKGYIGAIKNFEIFQLPKMGDTITTETSIIDQVFNATSIKAIVYCGSTLMAQCEMKVFTGNIQ